VVRREAGRHSGSFSYTKKKTTRGGIGKELARRPGRETIKRGSQASDASPEETSTILDHYGRKRFWEIFYQTIQTKAMRGRYRTLRCRGRSTTESLYLVRGREYCAREGGGAFCQVRRSAEPISVQRGSGSRRRRWKGTDKKEMPP